MLKKIISGFFLLIFCLSIQAHITKTKHAHVRTKDKSQRIILLEKDSCKTETHWSSIWVGVYFVPYFYSVTKCDIVK